MSERSNQPTLGYSRQAGVWQTRGSTGSIALRLTGPLVWVPAAFITLAVFGGLSMLGLIYLGQILAPAVAYMTVACLEMILRELRERRARVVLAHVENAVRLNLPLAVFLSAAARSERGVTRRRLVQVQQYLNAGTSLSVALDEAVPEMPARWSALMAAGERNGSLAEALTRLVEDDVRWQEALPVEQGPMYRGYVLAIVIAALTMVTGIMIFVIPKFQEIFKDFRTTMPVMTQYLIAGSDWVANQYGWLLLVPLMLLFIALLARLIRKAFMPSWPPLIPSWVFRWLLWYVPVTHGLLRNRAMADICQVLADGLRRGRPLVECLRVAAALDLPPQMGTWMVRWIRGVEAGRDAAGAARAADMPEVLVGFLYTLQIGGAAAARERSDAMAALMDFMAGHFRGRFSRTAIVVRAAVEPLLVLAMALAVGFIVVALFLPLVKLIQSVSGGSESLL